MRQPSVLLASSLTFVLLLSGLAAPVRLSSRQGNRGERVPVDAIAFIRRSTLAVWEEHGDRERVIDCFEPGGEWLRVSPNGRFAAFRDGSGAIIVKDLWGNQRWRPRALSGGNGPLSWSPDSSRIACAGANGQIYVWSVKTGRMYQLTLDEQGSYIGAEWAPAGDLIAVVRWTESAGPVTAGKLRLISARNGRWQRTAPGGEWEEASWAPDGNHLVGIYRPSLHIAHGALALLSIATGRVSILQKTENPEDIRWAPRGDWIAMIRYRRDTGPQGGDFEDELILINARTQARRVLWVGPPKLGLGWRRDSERILVDQWLGGHTPSVWEVDVRTKQRRLVVPDAEDGNYCRAVSIGTKKRSVAVRVMSVRGGTTPMPRSNAPSLPAGREPLTLVGFADPSTEPGKSLCLAGGWSKARGWVIAPVAPLSPEWHATDWTLLSRPNARAITLRSKAVPHLADGLDSAGYDLLAPFKGGVGVSRAARPRARVGRPIRPNGSSLRAATRKLLKRHGVRTWMRMRVVEAWAVDLDGDGRKEVLWTARSRDAWIAPYFDPKWRGHAVPGDYALVGMRYVVDKRVRWAALAVASANSAAPTYQIFCPLDLNGDGRMEILAHARYFEEGELLSFTFDGRRITGILGTRLPGRGQTAGAYHGD